MLLGSEVNVSMNCFHTQSLHLPWAVGTPCRAPWASPLLDKVHRTRYQAPLPRRSSQALESPCTEGAGGQGTRRRGPRQSAGKGAPYAHADSVAQATGWTPTPPQSKETDEPPARGPTRQAASRQAGKHLRASAYKLLGKLLEILEAAQPPSVVRCWIGKGHLLRGDSGKGSGGFCLRKETRTGVKLRGSAFSRGCHCCLNLPTSDMNRGSDGFWGRETGLWVLITHLCKPTEGTPTQATDFDDGDMSVSPSVWHGLVRSWDDFLQPIGAVKARTNFCNNRDSKAGRLVGVRKAAAWGFVEPAWVCVEAAPPASLLPRGLPEPTGRTSRVPSQT